MPLKLYEKIMVGLQKMEFDGTLLFSAFSEPLLHKNLSRILLLSRKYCPKGRTEIVTNGDFINVNKLRELFKAGLITLCISLYDVPHQVERFQSMKKEAGLTNEKVVLRI